MGMAIQRRALVGGFIVICRVGYSVAWHVYSGIRGLIEHVDWN